jgi:hypothetical protein
VSHNTAFPSEFIFWVENNTVQYFYTSGWPSVTPAQYIQHDCLTLYEAGEVKVKLQELNNALSNLIKG